MRISDWSSDVCSSDLIVARDAFLAERHHRLWDRLGDHYRLALVLHLRLADLEGRGLFREREEGVVEHLAQRVRRDVADHADEEAVAPETLRDEIGRAHV